MFEIHFYEILLVSIVSLVSIVVYSRLRKPLEYRQLSSHVPSVTKTIWSEMKFSWNMAMAKPKDLLPLFMELKNQNGLVVHFNLAGQACILLNDPDDLKILLSSTKNITKSKDYQILKPWLNEGLLLSSGSKWQSRRKLLTSTFHFKTLDMYNVSINKHSRVLARKLLEASTGDKEIDVMNYITLCSLDMICDTIMGIEVNAQEGKSIEYVKAIKCVCRSIVDRVFTFWLWNDFIFKISESGRNFYKSLKVLHEFTDNVIKIKKESLNNSKSQHKQIETNSQKMQTKSFLDTLLNALEENPDQMTNKDIREEVDTFLFEGHDTSSIAITIALIFLGLNQDVQDRARDEILEIFGDSDRDVTMDDLNSMKYLEAIVKETLRLYPSVPAITREIQTTLNIKNYSIPPLTTIFIIPYILHRSEDLYPNPEEFIPERFLDEDSKSRNIFGYLPFSAGPRNCIGQKFAMTEIKTVISTILRKLKFETIGTKEDIKVSAQVVIRLDSAPKIKFHELKQIPITMYGLNVYTVVALVPLLILILRAVYSRLQKPLEYRQLSSHVPSLTKSFWDEVKLSVTVATKHPKEMLPLYMELMHNKGPIVHFNIAGRSYVLLKDPDDLKILLSNTQNINKGPEYRMLRPWLNDGLLVSSGSKWQNRRKLLTNTFHFRTLDMYNPSINKHSRVLAKKLLEASSTSNKEISITEYVTLCSLDIICETIMGTEINAQEGKSVQYVQSIKSACRSVTDRIFKFWLWNDFIFRISGSGRKFYKSIKVLHDFTDNVIKNKRALLKNAKNQNVLPEKKYGKTENKSFLDILLNLLEENPDQMTDKDIREEVDTFLFEGHDTSSVSMTLTLLLLAMHQDVQDRARDELYGIFGDSDRDATMQDLNSMKYTEAVIKESLRLYPSVPGFTRELQTTLHLKNFNIPPMTTVCVFPFIQHRDEKIFTDPEEFIPERFLDEDIKSKLHVFGYIPFSAGARNCIGQKYAMNQMKIVVSTVLRNARIETLGDRKDIQISMQLVIRLESLPKVRFYEIA
ncbi:uncharacterized protein LOC112683508 [Sipha flava]|uniref:Uncharacterized protein LOC112683508 n=3 Tax=Sipha flava TaxID=143950 RepID=A0A8B8FIG0_9HEMI|nr:uncharacterized protein LOC112683508 [Sipha flava]